MKTNLLQKRARQLEKKNMRILKTLVWSMVVTVSMIGLGTAAIHYNGWSITNRIIVTFPFELKFYQPFRVEEIKPEVIVEREIVQYPGEIDTPIKKYICDKFGPYDCKIALAIVEAESRFKDQAINANKNGSVDLGCWQINFPTHSGTISPKDALDCYKATDWAFSKYKRDGSFSAWVAFNSGSFKAHL